MRDIIQWYTIKIKARRSSGDAANAKDLAFGWIENHPPVPSPSPNNLIDFCADGRRVRLERVEPPTEEIIGECLFKGFRNCVLLQEKAIGVDKKEDGWEVNPEEGPCPSGGWSS